MFMIIYAFTGAHLELSSLTCLWLQKEQQIETTSKNSIITCKKTLSKPLSKILPLKICLIEPCANAKNAVCDLSIIGTGNK